MGLFVYILANTACGLYTLTHSTIMPSIGQNKYFANILFKVTSVFTFKMSDHYGNHRCLEENNVPIAFILTHKWQYRADSPGIGTKSCL